MADEQKLVLLLLKILQCNLHMRHDPGIESKLMKPVLGLKCDR